MIRLFLLLVLALVFVFLWLWLRRNPTLAVACETLADDETAKAVVELKKAERDVDRELKVTQKRIKREQSTAELLAGARKRKTK